VAYLYFVALPEQLRGGPQPGLLGGSARAILLYRTAPGGTLRDYELLCVINPDIADEDLSAAIERVSNAIVARGGEVADVQPWGRRRLAYPIQRHVEGTYVLTNLRLDPSRTRELESSLFISEDVLRHLLVRKDES
jgi:small subunit ribosomal protein S6